MKFLLSFALVALYCATVHCGTINLDEETKMLAAKKACMTEVPDLTEEMTTKLKNHEFIDEPALKKFLFCFHKKAGFQGEDGGFLVDNIKEKVSKFVGSHDHDADVEECTKEDHEDGPDNAWAFATCFKPKLPKVEF